MYESSISPHPCQHLKKLFFSLLWWVLLKLLVANYFSPKQMHLISKSQEEKKQVTGLKILPTVESYLQVVGMGKSVAASPSANSSWLPCHLWHQSHRLPNPDLGFKQEAWTRLLWVERLRLLFTTQHLPQMWFFAEVFPLFKQSNKNSIHMVWNLFLSASVCDALSAVCPTQGMG